ncbi:hypothetical protein OS493_006942 [Desmophyllum pertusum]|uniref:Uncharacterized protein n=1 Tax=Desmophyllum pertusum TaxID=174260 RepID=A0A9X0D5Y6_9CNID|nr:hypothetical protein OS493_006942 [Desmophyllum pertusum]
MSRGLLSGLNKAEKSPYAGWKTNSFVEREPSPENDEVCLLDDDQGPSTPSDSKKCLSDGVRNPWEFSAKSSQFQIPKRPSGSPDDKDKKGQQWFDSSFDEEVEERHGNCQTRPHNQKQRNNANYANKQKAACMDFEKGIGYRIRRQALITPKRRWKHANPPGTLSPGRGNNVTSSARESSPYQVTNARVPEKCNGHVSADTTKSHVQRNCSSLDEEQKQNLSVLDHIMTGKSVAVCAYSDGDDTGSDSNFRKKSRLSCVGSRNSKLIKRFTVR